MENVLGFAPLVATLLRFRARACMVLACVAAMLFTASIASANATAETKTPVWDFSFAEPLNTWLERSASPRTHPAFSPSQSELASVSPHAARGITAGSRVNMPAWRKIAINMKHIRDRHMPGDKDLAPSNKKDLFQGMTEPQVERAVREAYRHGEVLQSQGERVFVRGPFGEGAIEMWVNRATKEIESAWPKF